MTVTILGMASLVFVALFTLRAYHIGANPRLAIAEAWVNIVIGFAINFAANFILFPLMMAGQHVGLAENWWGGWCYTAISVIRQYAIRRWFQERIHSLAVQLAGAK